MSGLRIGDADRDRAAADLGEHFAQGRLSADEHAERLDALWTSRTDDDVAVLFEDLPSSRRLARGSGRDPRHHHRHHRHLLLPVVAVTVVLTVLTHLPFVLLAVGAFVFVGVRRSAWRRGGAGPRAAWLS